MNRRPRDGQGIENRHRAKEELRRLKRDLGIYERYGVEERIMESDGELRERR